MKPSPRSLLSTVQGWGAAMKAPVHELSEQTPEEVDEALRKAVRRRMRGKEFTQVQRTFTTRAAVAGSFRVRRGLRWEWQQTPLRPEHWREDLRPGHQVLLVEVAGDGIPQWDAEAPAELAAAARGYDVPTIAWVTAPVTADVDLSGFDHVFAADQSIADALAARGITCSPALAGPATQPRMHGGRKTPGFERTGNIVVRSEPGADPASATDAEIDEQVKALSSPDLVTQHWDLAADDAPKESSPLASEYDVLLDCGRRTANATWPLLDALASRTAVVTTPERSLDLPEHLREHVAAVEPHDMQRHARVLATQPEFRDRMTHRGLRAILQGPTFTDRAAQFLDTIGVQRPVQERTVSIVVPTNRPHELDNILENAARQERVDVELILLTHGFETDEAQFRAKGRDLGLERINVVPVESDLTLGAVLNRGLEVSEGAYIAKMDDDNFYGAQFLGDLVDAFAYTSAGITGKWAHYVWLRSTEAVVLRFEQHEHTYHRLVQGGSIVATRDVAHDIRFSNIPRAVDSDFLNRAMGAGVQTYSGDRYNFVSIRGDDRMSHTWKIDDIVFMSGSGRVVTYGDPRELVSV